MSATAIRLLFIDRVLNTAAICIGNGVSLTTHCDRREAKHEQNRSATINLRRST